MSGSIDVVYPLGTGSHWDNGEIRYSLRALEKNFLDLGRVFVCGVKPAWMTGVVHLPVPDRHQRNKDANLIDKVLAACENGVSRKFVRLSDDQLLLRPLRAAELIRYQSGDLREKDESYFNTTWRMRLRNTREALVARGLTTWHFDTHIPTLYDRLLFQQVFSSFDYQKEPGFTINTLYGNHEGLIDPPPMKGMKLTLEKPVNSVATIKKKLADKRYLGFNDKGLTDELKQVLAELFPTPSRFELPASAEATGGGTTSEESRSDRSKADEADDDARAAERTGERAA